MGRSPARSRRATRALPVCFGGAETGCALVPRSASDPPSRKNKKLAVLPTWGKDGGPLLFITRPAGGIFAAGGFPASQVALLLIAVQHHPYLPVQRVIKQRQPLLDILMYGCR